MDWLLIKLLQAHLLWLLWAKPICYCCIIFWKAMLLNQHQFPIDWQLYLNLFLWLKLSDISINHRAFCSHFIKSSSFISGGLGCLIPVILVHEIDFIAGLCCDYFNVVDGRGREVVGVFGGDVFFRVREHIIICIM